MTTEQRLYRHITYNKAGFKRLIKEFCSAVGDGNPDDITDALYGRYVVEDFHYSDDYNFAKTLEYLDTVVVPHKVEVYKAGVSLLDIAKKSLAGYFDADQYLDNLLLHDLSKFSFIEAYGYSAWNFKTKTGNRSAFDVAWNHHKHNNPHHPEHWLSVGRGGNVEALPMPDIYVVEMVADWIGAGKTYGNSLENWLPENLPTFVFHEKTLLPLSRILAEMGIEVVVESGQAFVK